MSVETFLSPPEVGNRPLTGCENIRHALDARPPLDDRHRGAAQWPGEFLLGLVAPGGKHPYAVFEFVPRHPTGLALARAGEQQKFHQIAVEPHRFGGPPDAPDLVVGEDTRARMRDHAVARHA